MDVIPAKAGIHVLLTQTSSSSSKWIPAFAGMTPINTYEWVARTNLFVRVGYVMPVVTDFMLIAPYYSN